MSEVCWKSQFATFEIKNRVINEFEGQIGALDFSHNAP